MAGPRGLVQVLDQGLHRSGLLPRGVGLLVGVSGGADSVALLRLLCEVNRSDYWGWRLVVGHVEHGIRGAASVGDAEFVRGLAGELGVGFDMRELKLGAECSEARARGRRYRAFSEMPKANGCAGLVLAHHADDQAETVLMRIFRGCGVEGLRAMAEETKTGHKPPLTVWRPLLRLRRAQLHDYLREIGQSWREDESNQSQDYLRNRVRSEVMPVIESVWPRGVEAIGRLSQVAVDVQEVMALEATKFWDKRTDTVFEGYRAIEFSREALREALPAVAAVVLRWAVYVSYGSSETTGYERISEVVRLIKGNEGGLKIEVGRGVVVELDGKVVRVRCERGVGEEMEKVWWD